MAKMTLDDLKKLRDEKKRAIDMRESAGKEIEVVVGMATCGIADGGKQTLDALLTELNNRKMTSVIVRQTGCMGFCYAEPTVEVKMPGMGDIIYGNVNKEIAVRIITDHILNKTLIEDHILNRPAADIMKN